MKDWIDRNPIQFLLYCVFLVVAVVGGILVLFDKAGDMTFDDYTTKLVIFAGAVGVLGAGKAVKNGMLGTKDPDGLPPEDDGDDDLEFDEEGVALADGPEAALAVPPDQALTQQFPDDPPEGAVGGKPSGGVEGIPAPPNA
jgi:hypothetical protein